MTINVNNALIGLSVLGGSSAYSTYSSSISSAETPAVTKAKAAFTLASTTPPWSEATDSTTSITSQIAAIKRLASIIEEHTDSDLADMPDIKTAFTTYKALENLRILAEAATKKTITDGERAALQKTFAKGIADLQNFVASAETDALTLSFGSVSSSTKTLGIEKLYSTNANTAQGVSKTRDAALNGMNGDEVFEVTLVKGATSTVVRVDLAQTTQPPTLDSVANAINAAIAAIPALDSNGNVILDEEGNPTSQWKSNYTVEKNNGKWGLVFNPSGVEKVYIDQVDSADALMVASGITAKDTPTSANLYRIEDLDTSLSWQKLNQINSVDTDATRRAEAKAAAKAKEDGEELDEDADFTVYANTAANAMVTDAAGNSYIVGTTNGDMGASLSDGSNDLFVTKVDSEGQIIWQRNLGGAGSASGSAISIAANGDIVVAGSVSGEFNSSSSSETDLLLVRFNAQGEELSATSVRQTGNETASAITVGQDGSIYVAGRSSLGGGNAVILKFNADGKFSERRIIDSGGSDSIASLVTDADGNILALTHESGVATLHKIDGTSLSTDLGKLALGSAAAKTIAVSDSGQIAIVGATNTALNGAQINTSNGGQDAFVTLINSDLSGMSTTYIGSASSDQADSVAFLNGSIYVGGRTQGTLGDKKSGTVDGFIAKMDASSGTVETISQWGRLTTSVEPVKITGVTGGATALGSLGLSRGLQNQQSTSDIVTETSLRVGDTFTISMDGAKAKTITIAEGETMATLAQKIRKITGNDANISTPFTDGKSSLKIVVKSGHTLELGAGKDGKDALSKLGLDPVRLVPMETPDPKAAKVTPGGRFGLGLDATYYTLKDSTQAATALSKIKSAISMIQSAYRSLYWDDSKANRVNGTVVASSGSAYQQKQLANYQAALARLS